MKRLTCEVCGSTDLLKQDGVFLCQHCGCKYSVEEVRKLMIEGTVDVSGSTVKVDNSAKLENLYTLARRAKEDGNIRDAARYYGEIRLEAPNDWEAAFYGAYFSALDCTIGQIEQAANTITNSFASVSNLIKLHVPDEEKKTAYTTCLQSVLSAGVMLCSASQKALEDSGALEEKELFFDHAKHMYRYPEPTAAERMAKTDFSNRCKACDVMLLAAGDVAENTFFDYELAKSIYTTGEKACQDRRKYINSRVGGLYASASAELQDIFQRKLSELKIKLRAEQAKKNEEYWKEHADEKQKLDAQISEIDARIKPLQEQLKRQQEKVEEIQKALRQELPVESELKKLKQQQDELIKDKNYLGLFAGKEKKQLQAKIDSLQLRIDELNEEIPLQRNVLREDVSAKATVVRREIKPLEQELRVLENERKQIVEVLTKDR